MTYEVRRAESGDVDGMHRVLVTTWHATYDAIYGAEKVRDITGRWHAPERLLRQVEDKGIVTLVARESGRILGTASIKLTTGGTARLDRLYVLPSHQGQGIGAALLKAALEAVPGAALVELEVEPQNSNAVAFYESQGFSVSGTTGDCGSQGDGIPAVRMVLRRQQA